MRICCDAIEKNAGTYRRYLKLKAKLMNLPILGNHDIVAPLPDAPEFKFTFEEAQNLVTRAYSRFDEEYAIRGQRNVYRNTASTQHPDLANATAPSVQAGIGANLLLFSTTSTAPSTTFTR